MALRTLMLALCALSSSAESLQSCHRCVTSVANSPCHMRPVRKPEMTEVCGERTAHCVIDRRQTAAGALVSIERRCSSREESKTAHNRCEETSDGSVRCFTFCYGNFCNKGPGRLYQKVSYWNYDEPEYADYVYDPEDAVLGRDRKRPGFGPVPVESGAAEALVEDGAAGGPAPSVVSVLGAAVLAVRLAWR